MKIKDLLWELEVYNPEAETYVIAHNRKYGYTLSFGGADGATKKSAESVSFYVDRLCESEEGE